MNAAIQMLTPDEIEAFAETRSHVSGHAARMQKWREENAETRAFNAVRNGNTVEISILDVIGYDYWTGGGVTSKAIKRELDANKDATTIKVIINSPGGDVYEGVAIHSMLNRHGATIEVEVIGIAASIASVIAMAGSSIVMHEGSMMMIHPAWTIAMGNKADFATAAEFLGKVDSSILSIYKTRTGRDEADIKTMVDAETWMTAAEAVSEKFATAVVPAKSAAPKKAKASASAKEQPPMTEPNHSPSAIEVGDDLTDEERDLAAFAAKQAVSDRRAEQQREFLANHPLVRARAASAPPLGGMRK
jgi:ATP-dependent protease ClpP protease subunit